MDQPASRIRPYALKAGEGRTYRCGIDLTVKSGEVPVSSASAFLEYRLTVVTAPVGDGTSGAWGGLLADIELGQVELIAKPPQVG